jgi:hypothetical protein
MSHKRFPILSLVVLSVSVLFADEFEIDENALFGDTTMTMIDSSELVVTSSTDDGIDSTTASFSGGVTGISETGFEREWFCKRDRKMISPTGLMLADLLLDVRVPQGTKAYVDAEAYYRSDSAGASFRVPELFMDLNIGRKVYFRLGKQVLQWGRGYFWNPTDLVNVEKKTFVERIGSREGTFGIKTHVPFGTKWNIYGFLDMNNLKKVDDLAGAARFEGLFGGTEAGLALWGKRGKDPIFGLDFSTTVLKWSLFGEMSITAGNNYSILDLKNSQMFSSSPNFNAPESLIVYKTLGNDPVVRLSAGVMRMFDFMDVDDRIMLIGEFYFNQIGDDGNVFEERHIGKWYDAMSEMPQSDEVGSSVGSAMESGIEFNSIARYYSAFFATFSRFIMMDMTLQLNGLVNWNHHCAMLTTGVSYLTLYNVSLGCLVTGYVGPEESEYTFTNAGASVRVTAGLLF